MSAALEIRDLHKRFVAGTAACRISATVLRGIDLTVSLGECVAIVGPGGTGKSTLLLCAAGLLRGDRGALRWFGDPSPRAAKRRAMYANVANGTDLWTDRFRITRRAHPMLYLVDLETEVLDAELARWVAERRVRGDAVLLAGRDPRLAGSWAGRLYVLRGGALLSGGPTWDRVAERRPPH
jgi:hypothetical protein